MRGSGTTRSGKLGAGVAARAVWRALCCLALLGGCLLPAARAQVSDWGQKQMGPIQDVRPSALDKVTIAQHLNQKIPLDLAFRDEAGRTVELGQYFGQRPVILSLVYYQ